MENLCRFLGAVGKKWLALMSCAIFTGIGIYVAYANKSNEWAVRASFAAAVFCVFIACYLAWRDENRRAVQAEGILKEIEETKPNLVLREPGARHIQMIPIHDGKVVFFEGEFVKVRFVNRPSNNSPNAVAKDVVAKIKIFDVNRNLVLEMDGRWDDKTPPVIRSINSTARDFLVRDFGIEDESNIDIAFFNPKTQEIIAQNNDNYNFQQWRNPHHILAGDRFYAEIRLVAVHVDATFSVTFGLGENRNHLQIFDETLDKK